MLLTLLLACKDAAVDSASPCVHTHDAAVVVTVSRDYATGSFATIDLDSHEVCDELFVTSGDPGVAVSGGVVYQFNRFGYDNLRAFTPGEWSRPRWERELGDAANPQDVALCAGRLFVSLYGRAELAILSPDTGDQLGVVDLSAFDDGDGVGPEPGGLVVEGDQLFVGMNRLDRENDWVDRGGAVAQIDCDTGAVAQSWSVAGDTRVKPWLDGEGVLAAGRPFGDQAGGLWAITGEGPRLLIDDALLEGELAGVAAFGDRAILTSLSDDYSAYAIWCADLSAGTVRSLGSSTSFLTDLAANERGEAWLTAHWGWQDPEASMAGLSVYDIGACAERTAGAPLTLSLAPYAVSFL